MTTKTKKTHQRWAHFRFGVIGSLLASPAAKGELQERIRALSEKTWQHPVSEEAVRFSFSTIERWYYQSLDSSSNPVTVLGRTIRKDKGTSRSIASGVKALVLAQYQQHPGWSYQLHLDNLKVEINGKHPEESFPSYSALRRHMMGSGFHRQKKQKKGTKEKTAGMILAQQYRESREIRSYESDHVNALWHLDFHKCSRKLANASGEWEKPLLLALIDDCSRLICHLQWYWDETAESLIHGVSQAFAKRELPRAIMSDNGSAMEAAEFTQGLSRLSILHEKTLPYSPYQNGKQEVFWAQVEGRLMAMLEGCSDLTFDELNLATQAWVEKDYNHKFHSEIKQKPIHDFIEKQSMSRPCPCSEAVKKAFTQAATRSLRKSDGTISIEGTRFEIPSRYYHFKRVPVRFARWDLSRCYINDPGSEQILCTIYPQDKSKNAEQGRRLIEEPSVLETKPDSGMAPLLKSMIEEYSATGIPPAYIPKTSTPQKS